MKYFLDTNLLIYAYDANEAAKQAKAQKILGLLAWHDSYISTQVLAEFSNTMLRKFKMPSPKISSLIQRQNEMHNLLLVSKEVVFEALNLVEKHKLPYYDAQILATAKIHAIPYMLSEDFATGATVEGIHFLNPFADDFLLPSQS